MKRIALTIATLSVILGVSMASAGATAHTSQYWICNTPSLKAVYEYPTGSYWQNQIAHYPDYYTAHNAQYLLKYGC